MPQLTNLKRYRQALDAPVISGYDVTTMAKILTKLVKDGNSTAVRLPKAILEMSGLSGTVELEAKSGIITLRKVKHPREGWAESFKNVTQEQLDKDREYLAPWDVTLADGLEDIPYDH